MVLTEEQALEVTNLARENKVLLMEAMWSRFIPTFQKAKEWVLGGRIGTVKMVQASFCFDFPFDKTHRLYDRERAGGSLYDAGVYPIEFTTGILEEYPTQVKAVATFSESNVDDYVAMSMKFKSGVLASLSCGFRATTNRDAYVYGDAGYVVVYDFLGAQKTECYNRNNELRESFEVDFEDGFCYEIKHFTELFIVGEIESEIVPHRDNVATSKIFEEIMGQIE